MNKVALAKKIKAQLDGIDHLERLTLDLIRLGIGNMNAKSAHEVEEQAKQLGNALPSRSRKRLCTTIPSSSIPTAARKGRLVNAKPFTARHSINSVDCTHL